MYKFSMIANQVYLYQPTATCREQENESVHKLFSVVCGTQIELKFLTKLSMFPTYLALIFIK